MIYDTIIIGAGAAGCSAAVYATRYNLKTLMLGGPMPGGLITEALDVENYPGYISIPGLELGNKFIEHATKLGAEYKVEIVESIKQNGSNFTVKTNAEEYQTKTIVLATGTHHRKLNIPGEEKFAGRGVSYCATCDAPFFRGKTVAVVGGGNSAVEGAQDIAVHAKQVYLISRSELKAAPFYVTQLRNKTNIIEIPSTNLLEINGTNIVESVLLDKPYNNSDSLKVDGVFVQIGYIPMNELAITAGISLTEYGYVNVDAGMGTNIKGIFAAGDLNNASNQLHQQVTSAAEGAIAAQSAYRFIQGMEYLVKA
jgi:thioredoxin reductase (NADPH)